MLRDRTAKALLTVLGLSEYLFYGRFVLNSCSDSYSDSGSFLFLFCCCSYCVLLIAA